MNNLDIFLIALGLAMDAFAVSIASGIILIRPKHSQALVIGGCFGLFQAGMPIAGWLAGAHFAGFISGFDHWIAFGLLAGLVGADEIAVNAVLVVTAEHVFDTAVFKIRKVDRLGKSGGLNPEVLGKTLIRCQGSAKQQYGKDAHGAKVVVWRSLEVIEVIEGHQRHWS